MFFPLRLSKLIYQAKSFGEIKTKTSIILIDYFGVLHNHLVMESDSKNVKARLRKRVIPPDYQNLLYTKKYKRSEEEEIKRKEVKRLEKLKKLEIEDDTATLGNKCEILANALRCSKHAIVYTGAGISTSANIPDYRGTNGVWTNLNKGQEVEMAIAITEAKPTFTHMCISTLVRQGVIKHVVSQNCDGLHIRSGVHSENMSEIHGNMYIEVCKKCNQEYYRSFDVTGKTRLHRHATGRSCVSCNNELIDSIVHFGERGSLRRPHNWEGAASHTQEADLILCLGSSLKVLRHYKHLWLMNRPKKKRPPVYIVNLQWTPKDSQAVLKINGNVDRVMKSVMEKMSIPVAHYNKENDLLMKLATPVSLFQNRLSKIGEDTFEKNKIIKTEFLEKKEFSVPQESNKDNVPAWFGKGVRKNVKKKSKSSRTVA